MICIQNDLFYQDDTYLARQQGYVLLILFLNKQLNLVVYNYQEKRLRVNMRLKKLQEKVKEHQEKVGEKVPISCFNNKSIGTLQGSRYFNVGLMISDFSYFK